MREKLYRFFMGRNGPDALGQATSFVCVALILINLFVRSYVLYVLASNRLPGFSEDALLLEGSSVREIVRVDDYS